MFTKYTDRNNIDELNLEFTHQRINLHRLINMPGNQDMEYTKENFDELKHFVKYDPYFTETVSLSKFDNRASLAFIQLYFNIVDLLSPYNKDLGIALAQSGIYLNFSKNNPYSMLEGHLRVMRFPTESTSGFEVTIREFAEHLGMDEEDVHEVYVWLYGIFISPSTPFGKPILNRIEEHQWAKHMAFRSLRMLINLFYNFTNFTNENSRIWNLEEQHPKAYSKFEVHEDFRDKLMWAFHTRRDELSWSIMFLVYGSQITSERQGWLSCNISQIKRLYNQDSRNGRMHTEKLNIFEMELDDKVELLQELFAPRF